jgi:hypothetical protein
MLCRQVSRVLALPNALQEGPTSIWPERAVAIEVDLEVAEEGQMDERGQQGVQVLLVQALHRLVVTPAVGNLHMRMCRQPELEEPSRLDHA